MCHKIRRGELNKAYETLRYGDRQLSPQPQDASSCSPTCSPKLLCKSVLLATYIYLFIIISWTHNYSCALFK